MHPVLRRAFLILAGLSVTACFDYAERIVFNADFSGYVNFSYRVPLYPDEDRSVLAFLPATEAAIRERYTPGVTEGRLRVADVRIEYEAVNDSRADGALFQRYGRVRYTVHFSDPHDLEGLLPGRTSVYASEARLRLDRSFPLSTTTPENMARTLDSVHRSMLRNLEGHSMRFSVEYPEQFLAMTNRGRIGERGELSYELPLVQTIQSDSVTRPGLQPRPRASLDWQIRFTRARNAPDTIENDEVPLPPILPDDSEDSD